MWILRLTAIGLSFVMLVGPAKADQAVNSVSISSTYAGAPEMVTSPAANAAPAFPLPDQTQARALMKTFEHMRAQQQQLQTQTRAQMLGALSTPHRALVANLVGQLAVAPNPDPAAIVRQLNAVLALSEKQGILRISASGLAQAQTIAQAMQAQILSQITPDQRSAMQQQLAKVKSDLQHLTPEQRATMERQAAQMRTMAPPVLSGTIGTQMGIADDAGSILLRILTTPAMTPFGLPAYLNAGAGGGWSVIRRVHSA